MFIKLDREYEIKTTLGTIRDIERVFGKSFFEVIQGIGTMIVEDQIKLLFVGARRANPSLDEAVFIAACEDNLGMGDLTEYLEKFFYAVQYPGLTDKEVQERIGKKLERKRG